MCRSWEEEIGGMIRCQKSELGARRRFLVELVIVRTRNSLQGMIMHNKEF